MNKKPGSLAKGSPAAKMTITCGNGLASYDLGNVIFMGISLSY